MRHLHLLALDTSTEWMSVAVGRRAAGAPMQVWSEQAAGGAQASARLIPMIRALMQRAGLEFADLDAIVFGQGPGAFTGLRTACAVAQGLALGARADDRGGALAVLPFDSLMAVAEQARLLHAPAQQPWDVLAMLDARMDEVYAGSYRWDGAQWQALLAPALLRPQDIACTPGQVLAGNVFDRYGALLPPASVGAPRIAALPLASAMLGLAPRLLSQGRGVDPALALPLYIRDKVASTTAERAAAQAAPAAPAP